MVNCNSSSNVFQTEDPSSTVEVPKFPQNDIALEGRRIVKITSFLDDLKIASSHSPTSCGFNNLILQKEVITGMSSNLSFVCNQCHRDFHISTSGEATNDYNIEHAAVEGIMSIGSGFYGLEEFLSTIAVPCMSNYGYSKIQNKLRDDWKVTSDLNMRENVECEKLLAIERGDVDTDGMPLLTVITDGSWSKRSYRSGYNALSGAASIVGYHTGKVIWMGVRNKFCRICSISGSKTPRPHICNSTFNGPSTAMEADIIVEGFLASEELYGVRYKKFIADGDSSVHNKLIQSKPYKNLIIEKVECRNHLYRNFNSKITDFQKDTKFNLSSRKNIKKYEKRFSAAIRRAVSFRKSMSNSLEEKIQLLQKDIENAPYHILGEHGNCDKYFCTGNKPNEINCVPAMILDGSFKRLQDIFRRMKINAKSLIIDVDSNVVEQFNSIIAKFIGGKRINFSAGTSYSTRCYNAVVQHNSGMAHNVLHNTIFKCDSNPLIKKMELKRLQKVKNKRSRILSQPKTQMKKNVAKTDNHYGTDSCEKPDMSEDEFNILKLNLYQEHQENSQNRREIEKETQQQSDCEKWLQLRSKLLTASNFGKVCRAKKTSYSNYVKTILYSAGLSTKATEYGKMNESVALAQLEKQLDIKISGCGLFIHPEIPILAATPDGILNDGEGIVEIKCPSSMAEVDPEIAALSKKLTYFKVNNDVATFNKIHAYYYQVQGQLEITGRSYCLFGMWTSSKFPLKVVKIVRDKEFFNKNMKEKLIFFYENCIIPELIDPRVARGMPIRPYS